MGHSLSQHTQCLKNNMVAENDFFYETFLQSIGPTRSHLARFARILLASLASCSLRSYLARFACKRFVLRALKNLRKKMCISIDSKCSETQKCKKKIYPFDRLRASRVEQSPSGVAQ